MALVAHDLHYEYGAGTQYSLRAVAGVSLSLECGDLIVIAGETGSGKSTLLRMLAGLLEPAEGGVEVDGISPRDRASRGRVAIVFQNPESQFFAESLLADVSFGPRNLGLEDPTGRAAAALEAVGLDPDEFGPRSPFSLSGGEARRAAIAGALAMSPRYLLLDEPTAGLDAGGRREVLAAIAAERAECGVAVVTHDPGEFLREATCVLALRAGSAAFAGTVSELTDDPSAYEAAGLRLPDVVRAQLLARTRGVRLARIETEPLAAARALLAGVEASR
ncbi:MAG: ATP-binding cassette domain-containing protein [Actinobacteria bacterium]|nr:ATP-binding cassette domain-containing protein [Actinomycetota bacterium]